MSDLVFGLLMGFVAGAMTGVTAALWAVAYDMKRKEEPPA